MTANYLVFVLLSKTIIKRCTKLGLVKAIKVFTKKNNF